jgi:hypothetical protein
MHLALKALWRPKDQMEILGREGTARYRFLRCGFSLRTWFANKLAFLCEMMLSFSISFGCKRCTQMRCRMDLGTMRLRILPALPPAS